MQILAIHGLIGLSNEPWLRQDPIAKHAPAERTACQGAAIRHSTCDADALLSAGQRLLLSDRSDEAVSYFEQAFKTLSSQSRPAQRAMSFLTAGFQALHQSQWRTGWRCLQRVVDSRDASPRIRVEAYAALSALYFRLGMRRPASAAAQRATALLEREMANHDTVVILVRALQVEFCVLDLLRQHEHLHDLASWPRHEEIAGQRLGVAQACAMIDACRMECGEFPFVRRRLDFLEALVNISFRHAEADTVVMRQIEYLRRIGLEAHACAARHELALAGIAARRPHLLRQSIDDCGSASSIRRAHRNDPEHAYCLAKLGELSGNHEMYIAHYQRYASQALMTMRQTCAYITVPTAVRQTIEEIPRDDIASRLHGRYRNAYQFILANLQREDLSIRHVADEIGVTERSLQLAFRSALGLSPSAVIRQCRMDRIRDELSAASAPDASMQEVSRRWGLRSRSALSKNYKAAFGELPSETPPSP